MKILVTGASGFVGGHVCRRLIKAGHEVFGLSSGIPPAQLHTQMKEYYSQDISGPLRLPVAFDCVVHLAAHNVTHVGDTDKDMYQRVNVEGTLNLLQAAKTAQFIFLSTAKVYKNEGMPLREDSAVRPVGAYEQSKWQAEETCRDFFRDKGGLTILRAANILGWGQAVKAVVPVFFEKALKGEPLELIVPASTCVQFVYVQDLVDAIEAAIAYPQAPGCFNIAAGQAVTVEELAQTVLRLTASNSTVTVRDRSKVLFSPIVCEKAYTQLGWKAKTSLEDVLKEYLTHALKN